MGKMNQIDQMCKEAAGNDKECQLLKDIINIMLQEYDDFNFALAVEKARNILKSFEKEYRLVIPKENIDVCVRGYSKTDALTKVMAIPEYRELTVAEIEDNLHHITDWKK